MVPAYILSVRKRGNPPGYVAPQPRKHQRRKGIPNTSGQARILIDGSTCESSHSSSSGSAVVAPPTHSGSRGVGRVREGDGRMVERSLQPSHTHNLALMSSSGCQALNGCKGRREKKTLVDLRGKTLRPVGQGREVLIVSFWFWYK